MFKQREPEMACHTRLPTKSTEEIFKSSCVPKRESSNQGLAEGGEAASFHSEGWESAK